MFTALLTDPRLRASATTLLLAAIVLVPLLLMLRLRSIALRAPEQDAAAAWFGYARGVQSVVTGSWVAWVWATTSLGVSSRLAVWVRMHLGGATPTLLVSLGVAILPPLAIGFAGTVFSHPVSQRLRQTETTLRESLVSALLVAVSLLAPLAAFLAALPAFFTGHVRAGVLLMAGALLITIVMLQVRAQVRGVAPEALTSGDLRDRLFALAATARVKLTQLYVLPMARMRVANAFAVRAGTVMLTDHLLANLSRREVDAVMAHEITHLQHEHPRKLALALIGVPVALVLVLQLVLPWMAIPVAILVGTLGGLVFARRFEWTADAGAVRLTGDPEALISGLARLNRLNHVPIEWSRWTEGWLTHPSTKRRADAIAKLGNVTPERVTELLRGEPSTDPRYEVQAGATAGRVFSTAFKTRSAAGLSWAIIGLTSLVPVATMTLALHAGLGAAGRLALAAITTLTTILALHLAVNWLATSPYPPLRRALLARMRAQGIDPIAAGGLFVGLAPEATARLYEGFSDWDVGFLFLASDRLVFVGDGIQLSLTRAQIESTRLVPGLPGWWSAKRVAVGWRDDARGVRGVVNLRAGDTGTLSGIDAASTRLLARIESWRAGRDVGSAAPLGLVAGPPCFGGVTSVAPRDLAPPRTVIAHALFFGFIVAGACALFGLPLAPWNAGFAEAYFATMAALIFQRLPLWRHRAEPEPVEAPPARLAA